MNLKKDLSLISKKEIVFVVAMLLALCVLRMFTASMPLDRDEGGYAYVAAGLAQNLLPYQDSFEASQPFIYYIYKTAFNFSGVSATAVRNFTTGYLCFVILVLYMFVRVLWGPLAAGLTIFIYFMAQNNHLYQGFSSYPEVFTQLPLLLSAFFVADLEEKYARVNYFIAGFFMATAFYIKLSVAPVAVVPLLYIMLYGKNKIKNILWYLGGFVTVTLLVAAWCAKNGILNRYIETAFIYKTIFMATLIKTFSTVGMFKAGLSFLLNNLLAVISLGFLALNLEKNFKNKKAFLVVCFVASLYIGIAALKGIYPHYYVVLFPFLAAAAGWALDALFEFTKKKKGTMVGYIILAIVLLAQGAAYFKTYKPLNYLKNEALTMDIFYQTREIAADITQNKSAGQTLFVWPNEPEIYFYTGIKAPDRFISAEPYEYEKEALPRLAAHMYETPTDYFVVQKGTAGVFTAVLEQKYARVAETKDFVLYKKK